MDFGSIFNEDRISLNHSAETPGEVIETLVSLIPSLDRSVVVNLVKEREEQFSTGIGNQVAIPHCRYPKCKKVIGSIVRLDNPIDFKAIDDQSVKLFFLIIGNPDQQKDHIKILGKISRIAKKNEVLELLFKANSSVEFMDVLLKFENP